jgi:acetyl-CoA synthetase
LATVGTTTATARLRAARDFLLNHRENYATAYRDYRPPALAEFNWALDWFDAIAADGGDRPALWIVEPAARPGARSPS